MKRAYDLPQEVALFPLSGAVLMPHGHMPLQIFEPRYLQMVEDVLKTSHRLIGIIQPMIEDLARIGTAGRITDFSEQDDGRMFVSLTAVRRFRLINHRRAADGYLQAEVDWSEYNHDEKPSIQDELFDRKVFLNRLQLYMTAHGLSTDWPSMDNADNETLINALAQLLPLENEEKQALLEAPDLPTRRRLLEGLIEYALRSDGEERLQ